jgi:cell wall-associated NlpC family hydrolase
MTAPVSTGLSNAIGEIQAIQAQIAALSAPVRTSARATAASFASHFAAALSAGQAAPAPTFDTTASPSTPPAGSVAPVFAAPSGTSSSTTSPGATTGADVVRRAETYLGVPYVWGGESRSGIDCSGLVQATYGSLGIKLPRVAADQAHVGTPVPSLSQARPGDLLFFGNPAYHVAIYLGHNSLIESPEPGKTVHITDIYQTPTSIRRILPSSDAAAVAGNGTSGLSAAQLLSGGVSPAVARFADSFAAAEAAHHLPAGLLAAVAQQESAGNVAAVSPAGAEGLMQLMPSTAAAQGVNPFDPSQAISAAARIFAGNLAQFGGSVPLALAAYNAGAGAVSRYGGIPPYPETQNYVRKITATLERL